MDPTFNQVVYGLLTLLNLAVAYFLKGIHTDFKALVGRVDTMDKEYERRISVLEFRVSQMDGQPARRVAE